MIARAELERRRGIRGRLRALTLPVLLAAAAWPVAARAEATPQDQAVAQSLYDEARTLMNAKNFAQACPKLEESQRLDPSPATEFHLADCYEQVGRTASAWAAFLEVASNSKLAGRAEREKVARERADALVPKLTKLVINVPAGSQVSGLVIKRNGTVVREGQWGTGVPVDQGPQSIEASAPGKAPWQTEVQATGEGKTTSVDVPPLKDAPPAIAASGPAVAAPAASSAPAAEPAPASSSNGSTQRIVAIAVAGVGVVGVAIGSVFGANAISKNSDANKGHCTGNTCDATGVSLRQDAVHAGNLSTIAFVVGGVAIAGGAVLWFTAPSNHGIQAAPAMGGGTYGAVVRGAF
jgi:serine/threonine-protein kinase